MKRINVKALHVLLILLVFFAFAFAGDKSKVGTTSGTQLLVPIGARPIALGGSVVASVEGAEALFYNPGGVARAKKSEFTFSNMSYIADINVNYFGGVYYGGNLGAIGFFVNSFDFGEIEETTESMPDGTGRFYSPSFTTAGVSYSRYITDLISAGFTVKYIYEGIMQTSASTLALDIGVQYRLYDKFIVGVVMKNVGGKMQYAGRNLEREFQIPGTDPENDNGYFAGIPLKSDIPSLFEFGIQYKYDFGEFNKVNFNAAFTNVNEYSDNLAFGLEYGYRDMIFLRGGYNYQVQAADEQIFGYRLGGGLKISNFGFNLMIDYSYVDVDFFDTIHVFTIKVGI